MSHHAKLEELHWRIALAEYDEFCQDLKYGLEDLKSAPSSYSRRLAWAYQRLSHEEAKRNFRAHYYIWKPERAEAEWGKDLDAPKKATEWGTSVLRDSAHLYYFTSDSLDRLKVHGAKRYCKLRESKSHEEALEAMTGVAGAEIDEAH